MAERVVIGRNSDISIQQCKQVLDGGSVEIFKEATQFIKSTNDFFGSNSSMQMRIIMGSGSKNLEENSTSGDQTSQLEILRKKQETLIRSLHAGMGEAVDRDVVKMTMLLRAHSLAQGYSGVTVECIEKILEWIQNDACPEIYRLGCSGNSDNRIQLSSIASALMGESVKANHKGRVVPATAVPIAVYNLQNREGHALISGNSFTKAIVAVAYSKLDSLFPMMLDIFGMSLEALQANPKNFEVMAGSAKGQYGTKQVASHLMKFVKKSLGQKENGYLFSSHNAECFAALAQDIGRFQENFSRYRESLEREMNEPDDSVLIDTEKGTAIRTPMSTAYISEICDTLKRDISLASSWISFLQRALCDPEKSHGLPASLVENNNAASGFNHLSALADSIADNNRKMASINHLPQIGSNGVAGSIVETAFDFKTCVENLEILCATLYLSAAQACEFRDRNMLSETFAQYHLRLREVVSKRNEDKYFKPELDIVLNLIRNINLNSMKMIA